MNPKVIIGAVIGLTVSGILLGYVFPIAMEQLAGTDTSSWGTAETAIWDTFEIFFILIPLMILAAYIYKKI